MSRKKLLDLIEEKNGYITTQDAESRGIHRQYLSMFVKEKLLDRVMPGLYQSPQAWNDLLYKIQQKKSRLIFSHGTALFLHGYSDRDPIKYSVTLPSGYNTSQVKDDFVETFTIKSELFELGKIPFKTAFGNSIYIYDKERTICDILRSRNKLDHSIVNESLKRYVNDPAKDLNKLMHYAEALGIKGLVRKYLEILL
jgi:predicted transcriptional regulator of viral defense system